MGWKCKDCGEADSRDNLDFPIMHETMNPGHKVEPDVKTTLAWAKVLGETK